jgi:hypothetical protein
MSGACQTRPKLSFLIFEINRQPLLDKLDINLETTCAAFTIRIEIQFISPKSTANNLQNAVFFIPENDFLQQWIDFKNKIRDNVPVHNQPKGMQNHAFVKPFIPNRQFT